MADEKLVTYLANRLSNVCDNCSCIIIIGTKNNCRRCNQIKLKIIQQVLQRYYLVNTEIFPYECECGLHCNKSILIAKFGLNEFNIWKSISYKNGRFAYKSCLGLTD